MVSRGTPALEPEWYLDVGGEKTGPFTAEQVMGLLSEGEIPAEQKITSTRIGNRWITAAELAASSESADLSSPAPQSDELLDDLGFRPPPRPSDIDRPAPALDRPRQDPALSLFDALQTARDRQGARWTPPEKGTWASASRRRFRFQALGPLLKKAREIKMTPELRRKISFGTLGVIALLSVWGIVRLAWRARPAATPPPVVSAPAPAKPAPPQVPPVQAVAPPRGPLTTAPRPGTPVSDRDIEADRIDERARREREEERAREIAERAVRDELERYRDYRERDERELDARERDQGAATHEEHRAPPRGRPGRPPPNPGSIIDPETEPLPVE